MLERACKHLGINPADVINSRVDSDEIVIVVRQGMKFRVAVADLPREAPKARTTPTRRRKSTK